MASYHYATHDQYGWAGAPKQAHEPALYSRPPQMLKAQPSFAATEFETDFEDENSDPEEDYYLGRRSEDSTSKRSEATLASFDEIRTPATNSIGFTFQQVSTRDAFARSSKAMEGPSGPSLFRISQSSADVDFYLSMSPPTSPKVIGLATSSHPGPEDPLHLSQRLQAQYEQYQEQQQQQQQQQQQPERTFQEAPRTSVPLRTWTPWQVADWMHSLKIDRPVIDQFYANDISGLTLIDLQYDDLKELGINSFGQRHRLWNEIRNLKDQTLASSFPPTPGQEILWQQPQSSSVPVLAPSGEVTPPQECDEHETMETEEAFQKKSRRAMRRAIRSDDVISPAESASIVAIEQLLPEPHVCAKGEACSKWKKQQKKLRKIATEFPMEYSQIVEGRVSPSNDSGVGQVVPSVIASSDLLGPAVPKVKLQEEHLKDLQARDPQDNVRQFLNFQHVASPTRPDVDSPAYEMFPPLSPPDNQAPPHANLRSLPKLAIPAGRDDGHSVAGGDLTAKPYDRGATPTTAYYRAPVHDIYRVGSPASEMDVPVTALPADPLGPGARDVSSSVPPDMRFGGPGDLVQQANPQPIQRRREPPPAAFFNNNNNLNHQGPGSRRRSTSQSGYRQRRPSFGMSPLPEVKSPIGVTLQTHAIDSADLYRNRDTFATAIDDDAAEDSLTPGPQHAGWMRKRRTKLLRHEWNESHYRLTGTQLTSHKDQHSLDTLECIDVDDYAVAVAANQSKLNAAMKRLRLNSKEKDDDVWKFGFQLTPATDSRMKVISGPGVGKTHHFAVKNANDRIDWMRELMLARAKKDKDVQHERFE